MVAALAGLPSAVAAEPALHGLSLWLNGAYDSSQKIRNVPSMHDSGRAVDIGLCIARDLSGGCIGKDASAPSLGRLAQLAWTSMIAYADAQYLGPLHQDVTATIFFEPADATSSTTGDHVHTDLTVHCPDPWSVWVESAKRCRRPLAKVDLAGSAAGAGRIHAIWGSATLALTCNGTSCSTATGEGEGIDGGVDVTLVAEPAPESGAVFVGWDGPDCPSTPSATTPVFAGIRSDIACTATFECPTGQRFGSAGRCESQALTLNVTIVGTGNIAEAIPCCSGQDENACNSAVSSDPPGISCYKWPDGARCSATFPAGTPVTLTASPAWATVSFAGWSGDCQGSDPTTIANAVGTGGQQNCTATFYTTHDPREVAGLYCASWGCAAQGCTYNDQCASHPGWTCQQIPIACSGPGSWVRMCTP